MVPHAKQDDLDASLLLSLALLAISMCRWSISCADVAGAAAKYRCAEALRNLSFASAAASAILRVFSRDASPRPMIGDQMHKLSAVAAGLTGLMVLGSSFNRILAVTKFFAYHPERLTQILDT